MDVSLVPALALFLNRRSGSPEEITHPVPHWNILAYQAVNQYACCTGHAVMSDAGVTPDHNLERTYDVRADNSLNVDALRARICSIVRSTLITTLCLSC